MKCEYEGLYSFEGCNEDAEPRTRFCRRHNTQGRSNEITTKVWGCGCLVVIILTVVLTVAALLGAMD